MESTLPQIRGPQKLPPKKSYEIVTRRPPPWGEKGVNLSFVMRGFKTLSVTNYSLPFHRGVEPSLVNGLGSNFLRTEAMWNRTRKKIIIAYYLYFIINYIIQY